MCTVFVYDTSPVLFQLIQHVLLLGDQTRPSPSQANQLPPPVDPVFPLVKYVLGNVGDDALAPGLAARVAQRLQYPEVLEDEALGVLQGQPPLLVGEYVKDLEVVVLRGRRLALTVVQDSELKISCSQYFKQKRKN